MLLFVLPALANNTNTLTFEIGAGSRIHLRGGKVGIADTSGAELGGALVRSLSRASVDGPYTLEPDATCETGAVGVLTLTDFEVRSKETARDVMVLAERMDLAGDAELDSYSVSDRAEVKVGMTKTRPGVEIQHLDIAEVSWSLVDCSGSEIYATADTHRSESSFQATSLDEARARMEMADLETPLLELVARDQARRYRGPARKVERVFFDGGSRELGSAASHVKGRTQNWERARKLWEEATFSTDPRVRAYASYNLALYHERRGDLDSALRELEASIEARSTRPATNLQGALSSQLRRQRSM